MGRIGQVFKKLTKIKDEFTQDESTGIWEVFEKDFAIDGLNELQLIGNLGAGNFIIKPQEQGSESVKVVCEYRNFMPNITFNKIGESAELELTQRSNTGRWKNAKQKWTIYLPVGVPTNIELNLGAGSNTLDFGDIDLVGLKIQSGVGSCEVDLTRQTPKEAGVPLKFDGGVGSMDIRVTEEIPARVKYTKGIGSFSGKENMVSIGNSHFTTKSFEEKNPYFDVKLTVGVGSMDWITE